MSRVASNEIEIAYDTFGPKAGRPLLILRGLGTQRVQWRPDFIARLVDGGHFVIAPDNRDAGGSTHMGEDAAPSATYLLRDMAMDHVGLLDSLGIERAHIMGISMGGMIVQQLAIDHPERVGSLTSIMSSTGAPGLPGPTPEAVKVLMEPSPPDRAGFIEHSIANGRVIGSPGFDHDEAFLRDVLGRAYDTAFDPKGVARQLTAVTTSGDRTAALGSLTQPTLVIHGDSDPLVPLAAGEATAAAVPGAHLEVIAGMGHDLPPAVGLRVAESISKLTAQSEI